jgi:hypothetical protein
MTIKKIGGTLAVVITMLAFNVSAQEQCADLVNEMAADVLGAADQLRCTRDGGQWTNAPIWQKAAGKGKHKNTDPDPLAGCEVHLSLAKLIYEERDFTEPGSRPRKNRNNVAKGAAQALGDGQLEYAVQLLEELQSSIATSKENLDYGDDEGKDSDGYTAGQRAYLVSDWANKMAKRIIADDGTRCIE